MIARSTKFYLVNGLTMYRLGAAPFLVALVVFGQFNLFKWLLLLSFLTDAIDGYLARKYKITSIFGARLDSIADDCTILAAIIGMVVLHGLFFLYEIIPVGILFAFYIAENILAFRRYKRPTSFHTYLAKAAAVAQGIFLLAFFFLPYPVYWLFFVMVSLTAFDLLEEIILILMLPDYRTNVKGLYWVLRRKKKGQGQPG
ncbi:MAG: CDP-alcohol phosphatidyltransferase family protein [Bacteroidetes bacterium]|nr:CDP-alcohol phosphatidyltransferase family protein [Bacteroidota bacterium]